MKAWTDYMTEYDTFEALLRTDIYLLGLRNLFQ
jgi:hypothetical protein